MDGSIYYPLIIRAATTSLPWRRGNCTSRRESRHLLGTAQKVALCILNASLGRHVELLTSRSRRAARAIE